MKGYIKNYHYKVNDKVYIQKLDRRFYILSNNGNQSFIPNDVMTMAINQLNERGKAMTNPILNLLTNDVTEKIETKKETLKTGNPIINSLSIGNPEKTIVEKDHNLTIEKFHEVNELRKQLIALDAKQEIYNQKVETLFKDIIGINNFLKSLNESINQNHSILLSIASQLSKLEKIETKTIINKKQIESKPIESKQVESVTVTTNDDRAALIEKLYKVFMVEFNQKFMGTKKLEHLASFTELINQIQFDSPDTIETSTKQAWTNKRSQGVFYWSAGNQSNAAGAMVRAIAKIQGNEPQETTKGKSIVKDKAYWIETLNIDKDTMALIIDTVQSQGNCNLPTIDAIKAYLNQHVKAWKENKGFWQWLKAFIKE